MYIVIELQTDTNGVTASLVTTFSDRNAAESKFHQVLYSAAISNVKIHSAVMLNEEGLLLRSEFYRHDD